MALPNMKEDHSGRDPISEDTALIYGEVVTVKPIPTRQVTQIVIEIPEEHHIAATQLLFKRNAFIMPCADKAPLAGAVFGVTTLGKVLASPDPEPAAPRGARAGVNVTQWLAVKGSDANFQAFLEVNGEMAAAQAVRDRCGVQSRAEIEQNPQALHIFMEEIYKPFTARFPNVRRFNPANALKGKHS